MSTLKLCVAAYFQTLILAVISNINEDVYCSDVESCIIECSNYRSCALAFIHCNNSTTCTINCSAQQSCSAATIFHSYRNQEIEINCLDEDSCSFLRVQYEDDVDFVITNNKSLTVNSFSKQSSRSIDISGTTTFSQTTINCESELSCEGMNIEINKPNITTKIEGQLSSNLNIHCIGVGACTYMRLNVDDDFENVHRDIEWNNFIISLYCNNSQSCQRSTINTEKLKINSIPSSSSFGDLYLYCTGVDESCLFMNIICPELVPFGTMYDYLYQESKCHISLRNSYRNQLSIISKHGAKMIDVDCDDTDDAICDGVLVFCTQDPHSYYCGMQYKYNKTNVTDIGWYCDNYGIYYVFPSDYAACDENICDYAYGCDEYIWLDDIAIIETSKIPHYKNDTFMSCSQFNPSPDLKECYMYCDSDHSCKTDIWCDGSTICHIECTGLMSCKDESYHWSGFTEIECPRSIVGSICSMMINPVIPPSEYGKNYKTFLVLGRNATSVVISISHNMMLYVADKGMKSVHLTILNSDDLPNWSQEYDMRSWWRIENWNAVKTAYNYVDTALTVDILCDRCYSDWFQITEYDYWNKTISVHLTCNECSGTDFAFFGLTSFEFDCYGDCSYSSISLTDSNADVNCHNKDSCDNIGVYLNPSTYASYLDDTFEYNVNILNTSLDIALYSLYGFNQLDINDTSFVDDLDITFHCGFPDYFHEYHDYDAINNTACSQSNPLYSSVVVAFFNHERRYETITAETVHCSRYYSCYKSKIHCVGSDCVIRCDGIYSCREATIYTDSTQNSVTVYCTDYRSCYGTNVNGSDIDYLEINCMAGFSCEYTNIYHSSVINATKGLNLTCYDKTKIKKVLSAEDKYDYPACSNLYIYCPFSGCNVNIVDSLYVDPDNINIFYAQGFAELNLQCHFNALTNQSTCYDTNYYCNVPDDKDGGNATSYVYKSSFDDYTGDCIGECCDYIFSHSPTAAPTVAPTLAPTKAPTYAPSNAPTVAPTRVPTSFEFDAYFTAKFYIEFNDRTIANKVTTTVDNGNEYSIQSIKEAMEYGYLSASSSYTYTEYMVSILNGTVVEFERKINFTATIFSYNDVLSHYAQFTENNVDFDKAVSDTLEKKWNVSSITFGVYSASIIEYKDKETKLSDSNITMIAFVAFTTVICIIGFVSFLHTKHKLKCLNKLPSIKPCDDSQYLNVIKYGMQSLDLYSDIAFCWEVKVFSKTLTDNADITLITVLYSLTFAFFLIPYSVNLVFAVIFERFIDNTRGANLSVYTRNYFAKYSKLFAILVIISGSVSASLQFINSSIFGHEFFHAGFSKYELSKLSKFRVLFTVMIENIPQFIIQLIYVTYFSGKDEDVVTFTFVVSTCSSIVSILSTIMAYFLQKKHIPKYQTKFNIEIILTDDANPELNYHRMGSEMGIHDDSKFKIEVRDPNVKKLHKRGNLRKIMRENIAKCLGKLSDNFELLYCVEQIDGLTFCGLCSSDNYKTLYALFDKYEYELSKMVRKIYQLNRVHTVKKMVNKYWRIECIVFDDNGQSVADNPDIVHGDNEDNTGKAIQLTKTNQDDKKEADGKTVSVAQFLD